jgi:hypothetical protein
VAVVVVVRLLRILDGGIEVVSGVCCWGRRLGIFDRVVEVVGLRLCSRPREVTARGIRVLIRRCGLIDRQRSVVVVRALVLSWLLRLGLAGRSLEESPR